MVKKTKVTQRSREEQWRRRVEQQSRTTTVAPSSAAAVEDVGDVPDDSTEYMQAEMRPMPTGVTTSARATSPAQTAKAPRSTTTPSAPRRTAAATRASRLAFQQAMSIEEEMYYVRSDIRQLVILTVLCLVVLVVLAFVIR